MAGSAQYTVGASTPVPLASAPAGAQQGPVGWFYITNGGSVTLYLLGSATNTTALGPTLAAGASVGGFLFPGDQVYGLAATGSATPVGVLQTGI